MLDLRNLVVALQARYIPETDQVLSSNYSDASETEQAEQDTDVANGPRFLRPINLSSGKAVLSLQDMIDTTIALKSNLDLEVIQPSSQWPHALFTSQSISSTSTSTPSSSLSSSSTPIPFIPTAHEDKNALHVAQAISGLQREVLLLRNDLNFELWLSRENAKRIGQLYLDRILVKAAEVERQGLVSRNIAAEKYCTHFLLFIHFSSTTNSANIAPK
jgi:hypothetical protein